MNSFYIAFARATYALLALLLVPVCLFSLSSWFTHAPAHTGADFLRMLFWPVLAVLVYGVSTVRAWWRVLRRDELIPAEGLRGRPVVGAVVAVSAFVAVVLILLIATVLRDVSAAGDHDLGPLGFLLLIAAVSAAIALLVGEWVLVGRDE